MANEIRIHTSVEVIQDVGASAGAQEGITYTNLQYDGNADYRAWGGTLTQNTAYTDANVAYWKNVVVSATSADAVEDSGWTEASAVTDGTLPDNCYVIAVEFVRQSIGTASQIHVTCGGVRYALLDPGESIVIPLSSAPAIATIQIHDPNYGNGTREAIVNVMVAGA